MSPADLAKLLERLTGLQPGDHLGNDRREAPFVLQGITIREATPAERERLGNAPAFSQAFSDRTVEVTITPVLHGCPIAAALCGLHEAAHVDRGDLTPGDLRPGLTFAEREAAAHALADQAIDARLGARTHYCERTCLELAIAGKPTATCTHPARQLLLADLEASDSGSVQELARALREAEAADREFFDPGAFTDVGAGGLLRPIEPKRLG